MNEARWCGDGEKACGVEHCAHIHCDHCGMHYSLESEAALGALTMEEDRALMLAAYNAKISRPREAGTETPQD